MKRQMKAQSITNWGPRYSSYWLTLPIAVGIIFIGLRFIMAPSVAAQGYGIPLQPDSSLSYGYVKGIRDIFAGLILLPFLWLRRARTTAIIFSLAIIIPAADFCIILVNNGLHDIAHLLIHGGTTLYMIVVSVLLFRVKSSN